VIKINNGIKKIIGKQELLVYFHVYVAMVLLATYWFGEHPQEYPYVRLVVWGYFSVIGIWFLFVSLKYFQNTLFDIDEDSEIFLGATMEKELMKYACSEGKTLSEVVQQAIKEYIEFKKKEIAEYEK